jgi:hypothetical protein
MEKDEGKKSAAPGRPRRAVHGYFPVEVSMKKKRRE